MHIDLLIAPDVDAEGVSILAIEEGDDGLVEPTARQGVPLDSAPTAYTEAKFVGTCRIGTEENDFGGVARTNSLFEKADQRGGSGGKGVACGILNHYQLEDTVGVLLQLLAGDTVVERLNARRETALGLAFALGICELPFVYQTFGLNPLGTIRQTTFPCQ